MKLMKILKIFNDINFECLIVNDASTIKQPKLIKPSKIKSMEILNMKENRGHARCNAFGIRYISKKKNLIILF
jgi:GT2 family glycosyltransferase